MQLLYPSYYETFRCAAGSCPDSCCHEWDVQVDADSAQRWRHLDGPLGDALREALYEEDGETYLRNVDGRCPMWRSDGLCRLQAERGHDELCQVCQQFPRLRHDYGDFVELGLELSCPEAARILLTEDWHWVSQTIDGGSEPDYDGELMDILRTTRPAALELLGDKRFSVPERLTALLMLAAQVQSQIDGAEPMEFDADEAIREASHFPAAPDMEALTGLYGEVEILTERWQALLSQVGQARWDERLCRFAQYAVCRYWLQAVSDWDLSCRVKLILSGCALLARLPGDVTENAQLWSKEIENSAQNVDTLLDAAWTHRAMTDLCLLGLLKEASAVI